MAEDIVVDANVFMHAANPNEERFAASLLFLKKLKEVATLLCVDQGYHAEEAKNRSQIVSEYLKWLPVGSIGSAIISDIAASGRIRELPRSVTPQVAASIVQMIPDKTDRVYVKVAHNSADGILVSHDLLALLTKRRADVHKAVGVLVVDAQDGVGKLS